MSTQNKPRSARFSIVFMLLLAVISVGVYIAFSHVQNAMVIERREASKKNLGIIGKALNAFASKNGGLFPDRAAQLKPEFLYDDGVLIHPSWPDRPGYVFLPGVRADDPADRTMLLYENVPERKRRLGIQTVLLSGTIETLSESEFSKRLAAQEDAWKKTGRIWMPEMLGGNDFK